MTRFEITGPTVPGWMRETVRGQEEAWPLRLLAAGAACALAAGLLSGVILWMSNAAVYYALP
jgi:hypothetical protein